MHKYLRSLASAISLTLLPFTVCAQQTAGWGLKAVGNILSEQHSGSIGGGIPISPDTPFTLPEFTSNTMEQTPWLREILEQAASKKAIKGIGPIIKSLLEYAYWGNQDEIPENPEAPPGFTMEQENRSKSELADDSMLDFHSWNESEHSTENTAECNISLSPNNIAIPQPVEGNSPLDWVVSLAKYNKENIGHEISACLSSHGIYNVDTSYVVNQLITALSQVKENSTGSEPCDGITTPSKIQEAAAKLTSDDSSASMVTVDVDDDEEIAKGLQSGRYLLSKTNDQRLVVAFHYDTSEPKTSPRDDIKGLIYPQVSLADKTVQMEVDIFQDQDGFRVLSSRRPPSPLDRVYFDGPRVVAADLAASPGSRHNSPEPVSPPMTSSTIFYPDAAAKKELSSAIKKATLYLIDVDDHLMYPLPTQKLNHAKTHIIAEMDDEFTQRWNEEIGEVQRRMEMMSLQTRVLALEEQASGRSSEIVLERKLSQLEQRVDEISQQLSASEQIDGNTQEIREIKGDLEELKVGFETLQSTSYNGVFLWKIPEIKRRTHDAKTGKVCSIYSAPFYTSRFGYKMCLRLYLNGDGTGKGTHISYFFTIMRGEYDALLVWPFQHSVTLTMLGRTPPHIIKNFMPDPLSSSFWQPQPGIEMNVASGCPQFAKVKELENPNFLWDGDSIFLKVNVDLKDYIDPLSR